VIRKIEGIIPVMITPFTANGAIDYPGLGRLVEWYIDNGSDALFAVCQSSEMQYLSLEERVELAAFVRKAAAGRVPVIASGHISESLEDQLAELTAIAATGVDGMVLVTNRLDARREGGAKFIDDLTWLLERLPTQIPLGLYECPAPYRRLLTDDELTFCAGTGRFVILKDVSCDLEPPMGSMRRPNGELSDAPGRGRMKMPSSSNGPGWSAWTNARTADTSSAPKRGSTIWAMRLASAPRLRSAAASILAWATSESRGSERMRRKWLSPVKSWSCETANPSQWPACCDATFRIQ